MLLVWKRSSGQGVYRAGCLGFCHAPTAADTATLLVGARPPGKMSRETLVGMAFVTTSALAVLVGDRIAQEAHDIAAVLFGTAVLVRPIDLQLVLAGSARGPRMPSGGTTAPWRVPPLSTSSGTKRGARGGACRAGRPAASQRQRYTRLGDIP